MYLIKFHKNPNEFIDIMTKMKSRLRDTT